MGANKVVTFLRKYMMLIATVIVVIAFYFITGGKTLFPMNIDSLISQNAYVFVLGTGMLLCILTGGNIDLSVGSVVCLAGGVGAIQLPHHLQNAPYRTGRSEDLYTGRSHACRCAGNDGRR